MVVLIKAAQLILSLSILVILHEFGHFLFAKFSIAGLRNFIFSSIPGFRFSKHKEGRPNTELDGCHWVVM